PSTAGYTWDCVQQLKSGDKVVCTQPPLPFKCPGAPQKIAYLIADRLRRRGILKECKVEFFTHAPAIFGVPYFARPLRDRRALSAEPGGGGRTGQARDVRVRG
ncbi:MAG TPA: hypothetical protein VMG39_05215, partial [Pseudolabrys sp.]|nr:hypothetical protein [Pseudolabrys sp.]